MSEAIEVEHAAGITRSQSEENFKQVDASRDGMIDLQEFRKTFTPPTSEGCANKTEPAKKFAALDRDGDGGLSLNEVELWAKENRPSLDLSGTRNGFNKADRNADGVIQPEEFDSSLSSRSKTIK